MLQINIKKTNLTENTGLPVLFVEIHNSLIVLYSLYSLPPQT